MIVKSVPRAIHVSTANDKWIVKTFVKVEKHGKVVDFGQPLRKPQVFGRVVF